MRKLFGKYRGRVENAPIRKGSASVEVSSPAGLGAGVRAWAMPCMPYAQPRGRARCCPPVVGSGVGGEMVDRSKREPRWLGLHRR